MYLFPRIDTKKYNIIDDEKFILDLLLEKRILLVHGTAFNWPEPDHFRIVFLPIAEILRDAMNRMRDFLTDYSQAFAKIA